MTEQGPKVDEKKRLTKVVDSLVKSRAPGPPPAPPAGEQPKKP